MILATSKLKTFAKKILKHFEIDKFFYDIIGSNADGTFINKTDIISSIIKTNNYNKTDVIMIGDKEHDIIGANNNQIDSIAVLYGYGEIQELKKYNPTFIINKIDELKEIF